MRAVPSAHGFVRVTVAGASPRDLGCRDERASFEDPLHAAQVLRRGVDLPSLPEEDNDLGARITFEMHVRCVPDVLAPTVFGGGEPAQHVRGIVPVQ
jgi:hypothetical protein